MRQIPTAVVVLCLVAASTPLAAGAAGPGAADRSTDLRSVSHAADATPRAVQADANNSTANAAAYDSNDNGRLDYDDAVELYASV